MRTFNALWRYNVSRVCRVAALVALITLAFGLGGCGGDGVITFTVTKDSDEQVVEGSNNPIDDFVPFDSPFSFNINLEQQLQKRDAKGAKRVELRGLKMLVTETKMPAGDTDNFDFLDSIEFYVDSENQERQRLAWLTDVPQGKQTLDLNVDDSINLKPYIEEGMSLKTSAEGTPPDDDTSIKGEVTIWVKAL